MPAQTLFDQTGDYFQSTPHLEWLDQAAAPKLDQ